MVYNDSIPQLTVSIPAITQDASLAAKNVLDFQDHTHPDMRTREDSQASSIAFVYRGSGCDAANEPTLGNMEKLLRLLEPKDGLNAVLGQVMYVSSCLISLNFVSDVS